MLLSLKEKELRRIDGFIDSYQQDINTLGKELEGISEKYRKIIEEETKSLREEIEYYQNQQNEWFEKRRALSGLDESVATTPEPQETKEPEPEMVVDTLYPENNIEDADESDVADTSAAEAAPEPDSSDVWSDMGNGSGTNDDSSTDFGTDADADDDLWKKPVEEW